MPVTSLRLVRAALEMYVNDWICSVTLYDFKCVLNRAYYGDTSGGCRETGEDSDEG